MRMYNYFRSQTSHRLRVAMNLKGLTPEYVPVDLLNEAHLKEEFLSLNPQGLVPALTHEGHVLIQSPAIIEWLEERFPEPALLPADLELRARVRAIAAIVGCDTHPLHNRRVLLYLKNTFGADTAAINQWCGTWIASAFDAIEALLVADSTRGRYCVGDTPTLADVYLIPQVQSSRRFDVDLSAWPTIQSVEKACLELEAFQKAAPAVQPDAV
jgi:maleylpyruvate isomerase